MKEYLKEFPRELADEAIYIIREAASNFQRLAII
jgi:hypothetical protein